jgi:hypothetical protein
MSIPYFRKTSHGFFNAKLGDVDYSADDNGIDAMGGSFLSELMFKCWAPEANGVIIGMQQAVHNPVVAAPALYRALLSVSHPCAAGEVAEGTVITINITGAAPNKAVLVTGVNGTLTITCDASGNGSATQTVGAASTYVFEALPDPSNMNTSFIGGVATVCVIQPCDPVSQTNDPH